MNWCKLIVVSSLLLIFAVLVAPLLAETPLPPPIPKMPSEFQYVDSHVTVTTQAQPRSAPGIFVKDGRYYRRRGSQLEVYTSVCNGASCSPGWYSANQNVSAPASGCSGSSGCFGSSSRRFSGGRLRSRLRGCGG